jgi:tryptophanyl-tRNA synthetase
LFIADLHAITEAHDPKLLSQHTLSTAAMYLACGVDPRRSTLFVQSHVLAHAHMARLIGGFASVGMLRRMIQFKEKSAQQVDASLGLLDYPVLMAADILLYQPHLVPVGDDQTQHLQLTRDLADRFNHRFGSRSFKLRLPEPLVTEQSARVMSLTDGTKKMSKSDSNDNSRINLLDPPDVIRAKIRKAKTDAVRGLEFGNAERPEAHNLLTLYMVLTGRSAEEVAAECADMQYGEFKTRLSDACIALLAPIQARYTELLGDKASLLAVLRSGAERAAATADQTLSRTAEAMGFLLP